MRCKKWLAGALLICAAVSVQAQERFALDPAHTNVVFSISHLGYSDMIGRFNEVAGELVFDEADPTQSSVEVTVQTGSVDTNHQKRDEHLRSPDFFNAAEFPTMIFKSTAVAAAGDDRYQVTGDLTLLGVTKPVTLEVSFNKKAPHPLPNYNGVMVTGFSAKGQLKRSDFGMNTFLPGIGDDVNLWIEAEGHAR